MKYLVEVIKGKNPEVEEKTLEYVITYLMKEGHISYTVQYHFDIYDFYKKAVEHYRGIGLSKKCAIQDTCEHFKITDRWIYRIIKKFEQTSSE